MNTLLLVALGVALAGLAWQSRRYYRLRRGVRRLTTMIRLRRIERLRQEK